RGIRLRLKRRAVLRQHFAVNEVAGRVAGEGGAAILIRQEVAAIEMDATRRGEAAGVQVGSGPVAADRVDAAARGERAVLQHGDVLHRLTDDEEGIALDVATLEDDVTQMMAVIADEATAPVVKAIAVLPHAGDGLVATIEQIEAEVHAGEADRFLVRLAVSTHLPAAQAAGDVDPAVQPEDRMADAGLRVLDGRSFIKDLAL